ncbi:Tol-Pal system beta propeller repeat protein TolB [Haliangium sp.]
MIALAGASTLALGVAAAMAEQQSAVVIELENPKRGLYPIAVPRGVNSDPSLTLEAQEVISFDLRVSGWFDVLDTRSFLADLQLEGLGIGTQSWKNVGAFGVVKYQVTRGPDGIVFEGRLYEVEKGTSPVLSRRYEGSSLRPLAHRWCNEVVAYYTGEQGFFGSKIAFVSRRRGSKQVMVMDFDGNGVRSVTRTSSINILPAWSPDGTRLAFTSYMRNNPDLYIVGAGGGRPRRVSKYPGMNTGASWSPDGSKIALTLSKDGDPEIYVIRADTGDIVARLTDDRAIDTSPVWSPSGREIAFVSDRHGGPQIFVMNADGSNQRRVSQNGSYNTTPVWSPRKDKRVLAYTTRDEGHYDIVTLDLDTNEMVRITQNQGSNEEPSFSPNGRAIAFASNRREGAGIYVANADGSGEHLRVYSGYATSVDWGPMP